MTTNRPFFFSFFSFLPPRVCSARKEVFARRRLAWLRLCNDDGKIFLLHRLGCCILVERFWYPTYGFSHSLSVCLCVCLSLGFVRVITDMERGMYSGHVVSLVIVVIIAIQT